MGGRLAVCGYGVDITCVLKGGMCGWGVIMALRHNMMGTVHSYALVNVFSKPLQACCPPSHVLYNGNTVIQ